MVKVTPIDQNENKEYEELNFGWSEIKENTRQISHVTTIPSAGTNFKYGPTLPDLSIRVTNVPDTVFGFTHASRNYGPYCPSALQELYHTICGTIDYDVDNNYVFPCILPQGAMYGWKDNFNMKIWPRNGNKKEAADKIVEFMKKRKMITGVKLVKIMLNYKAVCKTAHLAEINVHFEDEFNI